MLSSRGPSVAVFRFPGGCGGREGHERRATQTLIGDVTILLRYAQRMTASIQTNAMPVATHSV